MKILVTGCAGFIGNALARQLLEMGDSVVGVDCVNAYYDPSLKEARLQRLAPYQNFSFFRTNLADRAGMEKIFSEHQFDKVVNLAAQAGVRHSLTHPHDYIDANLTGFVTILENCRHAKVPHLIYASTSSVYGANTKLPFSVKDSVDHPLSLYAATKRANELFAHTYSHLFDLPTTGLRFFTVYGPWGRPDMALFKFTKNILEDKPIDVFNFGKHRRDFTYIADIVEGIFQVIKGAPPVARPASEETLGSPDQSSAPFRIYNIGNAGPIDLMEYIEAIETALGKKAEKNYLPVQPGDVEATCADVTELYRDFGYRPQTTPVQGIRQFIDWYRSYYGV